MGFDVLSIVQMIGGLALFIYGMTTMGKGLERAAGSKLEKTLEKMTGNVVTSLLMGMVVTMVIQSSSATTVMVVGFVNAGIKTLKQTVGVILGAIIGTTITAQILRLSGGEGSGNLMKAESPGPSSSKLLPRTNDTAKMLYSIYILLTAAETLALRAARMPWFDAVTTALTTISTGGFSVRNESIAYYQSSAVNWIIVVFMFVSSVNFTLLFLAGTRRWREVLRSDELRVYSGIVFGSSALIALDLVLKTGRSVGSAIEHAAFQVTTLISTTGYCTEDFDLWPQFSRLVLLIVMFVGGCAGSTAGGIKVSRIVLLFKGLKRDLRRILHTREVRPITLDGQRVEEDTISSVSLFFFAYMIILFFSALIVSLDELDFTSSFTASLTCISNVGPGLGLVGPTCNFGFLSPLSKLVLSFTMLLGRLEIMPLLVLFFPSVWQKK